MLHRLSLIAVCAAFMLAMAATIATGEASAETATYYDSSYCGNLTASGEVLDCGAYTAAHPTLPFGSVYTACYVGCVDVVINDRGPTLDLTPAAAEAIGMLDAGVIQT